MENPVSADERLSRPTGLGWLLWVVAASLPWLLPTHSDPWTTIYSELLMAAVLLASLGWAIWASKRGWPVSRLVLVLVGGAAIPLGQSIAGLLIFPGEAVLQAACVWAFACAVSLGQRAQLCEPYRLIDSLFASLVFAAVLSTGLALYQWFGLGGAGVLLPSIEVGGGRAVGHVGQANNLSTLLVWGCVGLWWAVCRRSIGGSIAALVIAFLLVGLVLTGSRTGCVQAAFLAVMVLFLGRSQFLFYRVLTVAVLGGWLVGLLAALPIVSELLFGTTSREMLSVGLRPKFWSMAIEALLDRPLAGYGWNQVVTVHVALSDRYSGLGAIMGHAHNIVLDLLLWNGVVLGGGVILGAIWWGGSQLCKVVTEAHGIILAALGVFLIHALLELPHLYAFFYLPVGVMVGVASTFVPWRAVTLLPQGYVAFTAIVLAALLAMMFRDYRLIETDLMAHRMVAARIAGAAIPESPKVVVLGFLQGALEQLRTEPRRDMGDEELEQLRRTILRYPTTGGLFRYAQSAALNHRQEEARWALQIVCSLKSAEECAAVVTDWKTLALEGNPEMNAVSLPPQ